jgi:hypothetical protein
MVDYGRALEHVQVARGVRDSYAEDAGGYRVVLEISELGECGMKSADRFDVR